MCILSRRKGVVGYPPKGVQLKQKKRKVENCGNLKEKKRQKPGRRDKISNGNYKMG